MRRSIPAAIAVLAALAAPGRAAPPATVEVRVDWFAVPRAGGATTVALCRAVALGTEPEVVAVTTEVGCSIDGVSGGAAAPGPVAVASVTSTATFPLTVCVTGRAAFVDVATNDVFSVAATPACVMVPAEGEL